MKCYLSDRTNGISSNINILRFVCALLVIICHSFALTSTQLDPWQQFTNKQSNFGGLAVAVFFFLSGFYTTKSLYRIKNGISFIKNRCIRIFPQLWMTVILSVFVLGIFTTVLPSGKYLLSKDTYLYFLNAFMIPIHNLPGVFEKGIYTTVNGALWTLPVEFAGYVGLAILWGMGFVVKDKQNVQKVFHMFCVIFLLVIFLIIEVTMENNDFLITVVRPMVLFFIGSLFWDYRERIVLDIRIVIFAVIIFLMMSANGLFNWGVVLFLPYIVLGITLLPKQVKIKTRLVNLSYEMYLVGWPIQQMLFALSDNTMSPWVNVLTTIPIDVFCAYYIYRFTEYGTSKKWWMEKCYER